MEELSSKYSLFKNTKVAMKSSQIGGARNDIPVYKLPFSDPQIAEITVFVDPQQRSHFLFSFKNK